MKNIPNKFQISYLAGYIDGDGCFYIGYERSKKRLTQKPVISIRITSINDHVLYSFKKVFGGSVSRIKSAHKNHKPLYQYCAAKRSASNIINYIFPYLTEKTEECTIVKRFIEAKSIDEKNMLISRIRSIKDESNLVSKHHKEEFEALIKTVNPTDEDFAYLAGFIDAECCLCIQKYSRMGNKNPLYKILLQCNNTKAPVFKWLLERFGGRINFVDRSTHQKAKKNQLTWRLSGRALSLILDKIYPFLNHKKPVCRKLMDFYATTLINGGARHTESFRTHYASIMEKREKIVNEVHKLNLKGIGF